MKTLLYISVLIGSYFLGQAEADLTFFAIWLIGGSCAVIEKALTVWQRKRARSKSHYIDYTALSRRCQEL